MRGKMPTSENYNSSEADAPIFAAAAPQLASYGLAVIPIGPGRKPRASGFNAWSRAPGRQVVADWCNRYPTDNIGILPGLSGKLVVDCDSAEQVEEVQCLLGAS